MPVNASQSRWCGNFGVSIVATLRHQTARTQRYDAPLRLVGVRYRTL
jgi:hypothetical protein